MCDKIDISKNKWGTRILIYRSIALGVIALTLIGCQTVGNHRQQVRADSTDRLTAGVVQREIKEGMTSADVVSILGSPNMVTTDEARREVWVYDKIATERAFSTSSGGVSTLVLGGAGVGAGAAGAGLRTGYGASSGAASTSQRTLTIVIKFDANSRVRDFAYRQSSF